MTRLRFLKRLLDHKRNVMVAGRLTRMPFWRLLVHDWTKFTPAEFGRYARWHCGPAEDRDKGDWALAWRHHQHHSPHHPEFYLVAWHGDPTFYAVGGIGERVADNIIVLPMPEIYVREMVADWLAASKTYTGSWDIAIWVNEHGREMRLHDETVTLIDAVMHEIGYVQTDNCPWSYMAGSACRAWAESR